MTAHDHDHHPHGTDMKAAFLGLIIGVIALFVIVRAIVAMTNAKYANERPAAEATK
jgi:hypothetical protein